MTELNADSFAPARSMWRELGDAIRGIEADYTRIGMRCAVFLLAVPMVLDQWTHITPELSTVIFTR